jgi:hypothetical protein
MERRRISSASVMGKRAFLFAKACTLVKQMEE